jgi:hypothetical protein
MIPLIAVNYSFYFIFQIDDAYKTRKSKILLVIEEMALYATGG